MIISKKKKSEEGQWRPWKVNKATRFKKMFHGKLPFFRSSTLWKINIASVGRKSGGFGEVSSLFARNHQGLII